MEEIKKYLEEKRKNLFHKKIVLAGSLAIRSIIKSAKTTLVTEWEKELEVVNQEYDKVKELLEVLEGKAQEPKSKDIDIEQSIVSVLDEVYRDIERTRLSRDTDENYKYLIKNSMLDSIEHHLQTAHKHYKKLKSFRS